MRSPIPATLLVLATALLPLGCGSNGVEPSPGQLKGYDLEASFETAQIPATGCDIFAGTGKCVRFISTNGLASVVGTLIIDDSVSTSDFGPSQAATADATLQACVTANPDLGCTAPAAPRSEHLTGELQNFLSDLGSGLGFVVLRGGPPLGAYLTLQPSSDQGGTLSGAAEWREGNVTFTGHFVARRRGRDR
jgi:hypothetical protein